MVEDLSHSSFSDIFTKAETRECRLVDYGSDPRMHRVPLHGNGYTGLESAATSPLVSRTTTLVDSSLVHQVWREARCVLG